MRERTASPPLTSCVSSWHLTNFKNFLTPRENYQRSAPQKRRHRGESSTLSSKIELRVVQVCTVQEELSSDIAVLDNTRFCLGVRKLFSGRAKPSALHVGSHSLSLCRTNGCCSNTQSGLMTVHNNYLRLRTFSKRRLFDFLLGQVSEKLPERRSRMIYRGVFNNRGLRVFCNHKTRKINCVALVK